MGEILEMLTDIDIDENEFELALVDKEEKERIKKNLRKQIKRKSFISLKRASIAAAVTLICLATFVAVKPAMAQNIPIISELFRLNLININKQYADYAKVIGTTKSAQGIDVTFESAAADDNMLFLNFVVKNSNNVIIDDYSDGISIPTFMEVNGKAVSTSAGASFEFIDNNTVRVLKRIDWAKNKLPDRMNIKISISKLFGKQGDWGVSFLLDKSVQAKNTIQEKIDTKLQLEGIEGKISNVRVSPLTVTVTGEGNFIHTKNINNLGFIVFDSNGESLLWEGDVGAVKKSGKKFGWSSTYISNENMSSLRFMPIYKLNTGESIEKLQPVKFNIDDKGTIELPIDEDRSIVVKEHFIEGQYLVVKYNEKYIGSISSATLFDTSVYITADGKEMFEAKDEGSEKLLRKYYNAKENVKVFKGDYASNLMIGAYDSSDVKLIKDKSFTIDLRK